MERKKDKDKNRNEREKRKSSRMCRSAYMQVAKRSSASASAKLVLQRFPISMLKAQRGSVS